MEIILENVNFISNNQPILNNLSFVIEKGKTTFFYGKSGSGKTTLINLINGYNKITSGQIKIDGQLMKNNVIPQEIKTRINTMFQFVEEQIFNDTVFEELTFGLSNQLYTKARKKELAVDTLKLLELPVSFLDKKVFNLSNSEKRKITFGSIITTNTDLIILDEPTLNLDEEDKKLFLRIIKKLQQMKKTLIIISHDIDLFYPIVNTFIVLNKGHNVFTGNKTGLIKHITILEHYNIYIPFLIKFPKTAIENKKKYIDYYDDVRDLMKDIYRNV